MASNILFPPIVDNYINTFQVKDGFYYDKYCDVYFSLSDFNADADFVSVQAVVYHKNTNKSVVNLDDTYLEYTERHYRRTGVILNLQKHKVGENLYYVRIYNADLNSDNAITHIIPENESGTGSNENVFLHEGWIPGEIYKIQLRLSSVTYNPLDPQYTGQEDWLNKNAGNFSQ